MRHSVTLVLLATLVSQVHMAPQFITFKDGKLGVNFGGYHAGVGIGGLLGGGGTAGGLFAEAGTPNGQSARAGLGGTVSEQGGASGGLFAGATAGGNVKASAGLAGGTNAVNSAGAGYASAQAGDRFASSGLAGESSVQGSYGATHELEVKPIKTNFNVETVNEVKPVEFVPLNNAGSEIQTKVEVKGDIQPPVVVKEVYVEPQQHVVEKHIVRTHKKPHRHHFYKTVFLGGYLGNEGAIAPSNVHETEPAVQKRIDIGAEANANAGASVGVGGHGGVDHTYTKQVTVQHNPNFFADIFDIPISTLNAVSKFLGNTAGRTNVSVQKSASFQAADSDSVPMTHDSSTDLPSYAHTSVETPSASKVFDDIFAIPISTLGAVNKFLENNVPARKNVEILQEGKKEV